MKSTNLENTLGRDSPAIALKLGTGLRAAAGTFFCFCFCNCPLTGSDVVGDFGQQSVL